MKPKDTAIYIGIDPGVSGGVALLHNETAIAFPMPSSMRGILRLLKDLVRIEDKSSIPIFVGIEQLRGFMQQGKGIKSDTGGNMPGARMFTMGRNYGALLMASVVVFDKFPLEIAPVTWQSKLSIPKRSKRESRPQFKKRLQRVSQSLYPRLKITAKTCDALLIATYMRLNT
jgi:hypothetical protein